jgi:ligand-binding SRPBCC domain-containing protein
LFIPELDQNYIDKLIDERDVDCSELDITYVFEGDSFSSAMLTNAIIREIFYWIIMHNVSDEDDQNKLIDSIYTNAFCS